MKLAKEISADLKITWKAPIFLALTSAIVLVGFGFLGKSEPVAFQLTRKKDLFQLDDIVIGSSTLGIAIGVLLVAATGLTAYLTAKRLKPSKWLFYAAGLLAVIALLGWLAAGDKVPVAFIAGNALVLAVPIILGGLAGVMSERVGVVNIAIEGQLLTGAFVAAVVSSITKNLWVGMISAMVAAALISTILAVFAVRYLVNQIIVGVVINVLVIGITNFMYSQWLTEDSQNVNFPGTFDIIAIPFLSQIPIIGPVFFENRITVYLAIIVVPILWWVLFKSKLGLRARAVGENPLAADTVGINVGRTRFWWVTLGGLLAGLGGAALTIGNVGAFGREMSGGQGFIALAVMILGRWHPIYVSASALLFGFAIILRVWANQVSPGIPTDFIIMVPYLVTLIAVVGFVGKVRAPAADGVPYEKSH